MDVVRTGIARGSDLGVEGSFKGPWFLEVKVRS